MGLPMSAGMKERAVSISWPVASLLDSALPRLYQGFKSYTPPVWLVVAVLGRLCRVCLGHPFSG